MLGYPAKSHNASNLYKHPGVHIRTIDYYIRVSYQAGTIKLFK